MLEFGDRLYAYGYVKSSDNSPYLAIVRNGKYFIIYMIFYLYLIKI